MELKALNQADYLDIIFDNRNKDYGSYQLRKYYGNRVGRAMIIMYSMIALLVLLIVLHKPAKIGLPKSIPATINPTVFVAEKKTPLPPKAEKLKIPPPAAKLKTSILTPPVLTNDPIPENRKMTLVDSLQNSGVGASNDGDDAGIEPGNPDNSNGKGIVPVETKPDKPQVFVEQMPTFDGNVSAYISTHIHYPDAAREAGIDGKVGVEFVVNEDGTVSNTRIIRSVGGGCDEEALRVVSSMPKWKPGRQHGIPVKVYFSLSIKFELR